MKDRKLFTISSLFLAGLFFIGIVVHDGPVWCVDSASYTGMSISREPVYPLFLMILRGIFGEKNELYGQSAYLFFAALLQSIFWAVVSTKASLVVYDMFDKERNRTLKYVCGYGALFCQFIAPILNRFVVKRRSMYSESIMTESLAMPIYVLFVLTLYKWETTKDRKYFGYLIVLTFIAVSLRKQMMILLIIWFIFDVVVRRLLSKKNLRELTILIFALLVVVIGSKLFDRTYNYMVRGYFVEHTGNSQGKLCTLLYSADGEDARLFDDTTEKFPGEKQLYLQIYEECSQRGILLEAVPDDIGFFELTNHYADSYDVIGYDVMMPICYDYIEKLYPDYDSVQVALLENELEKDLAKYLMGQDKKDLIRVYIPNLVRAFVYSNSSLSPRVLVMVSFIMYGVFAAMVICVLRQFFAGNRKQRAYYLKRPLLFSLITIMGIAVNAGVVALLIFPQGRYMAYSMGLFYTCIFTVLPFSYLRETKDA